MEILLRAGRNADRTNDGEDPSERGTRDASPDRDAERLETGLADIGGNGREAGPRGRPALRIGRFGVVGPGRVDKIDARTRNGAPCVVVDDQRFGRRRRRRGRGRRRKGGDDAKEQDRGGDLRADRPAARLPQR